MLISISSLLSSKSKADCEIFSLSKKKKIFFFYIFILIIFNQRIRELLDFFPLKTDPFSLNFYFYAATIAKFLIKPIFLSIFFHPISNPLNFQLL